MSKELGIIAMALAFVLSIPVFATYPDDFRIRSEMSSWIADTTTPQQLLLEAGYACKNAQVVPHQAYGLNFKQMQFYITGVNSTGHAISSSNASVFLAKDPITAVTQCTAMYKNSTSSRRASVVKFYVGNGNHVIDMTLPMSQQSFIYHVNTYVESTNSPDTFVYPLL